MSHESHTIAKGKEGLWTLSPLDASKYGGSLYPQVMISRLPQPLKPGSKVFQKEGKVQLLSPHRRAMWPILVP